MSKASKLVTVCCGRAECGGECGNEWRGMEPAEDLIEMSRKDANNYSLILALLGMEEEGDPVAEVGILLAERATSPPAPQPAVVEALTPEQISAVYLLLVRRKRPEFGWMEVALLGAEKILEPLHSAIHDAQFDAMDAAFRGGA